MALTLEPSKCSKLQVEPFHVPNGSLAVPKLPSLFGGRSSTRMSPCCCSTRCLKHPRSRTQCSSRILQDSASSVGTPQDSQKERCIFAGMGIADGLGGGTWYLASLIATAGACWRLIWGRRSQEIAWGCL